ncbi:complex I subunit 5 family protein [Halomonas chromatireducens]|uniref:Hydrogenase-4 component B n=1 Tax=Halomonas chromatireducens TaxID=507626 RepID=A0A0X8HE68_9GAMM|nr:complex I subunit 5 family protein [Halomonas chromatireducens]AMD01003.1 Hydrogenase-4 component B [Halomonas chromatireducens]
MTATLLLILAVLWPLVLMLRSPLRLVMEQDALWRPGPRPKLLDAWWASAPLPALVLALWPGEATLLLEGWLLGGVWQLDEARRPWLLFSALLWGLAGVYARGYLIAEQQAGEAGDGDTFRRLTGLAMLWPLTLAGNLLLLLAEDIPSFYLGFAVMTFAAYGLVVHADNRDAHLGGRAYLIMALFGEALILGGLLWAAGSAETLTLTGLRESIAVAEQGPWMAAMLWLGFGVKAGVVGLHVWLPLAHPVAPTPASAILSGVMIKAGLVGWLSVLPLGDPAAGLEPLGRLVTVLGVAGALGAALFGITQRHPKAVLAYSSVSQMGMLTALVGIGLTDPALWPALSVAVVLFAAHHGMTKGALFLGIGISEHPPRLPTWLLWPLLALPALSLTGALASGLASKWAFKSVLYEGGHGALLTWLSLAAVGTTLLMARALWRQWRERGLHAIPLLGAMPLAWLFAIVAATSLPLWLPVAGGVVDAPWPPPDELPGLLWPAGAGLALAGLGFYGLADITRRRRVVWRLMPGDLWWLYAALTRRFGVGLKAFGDGLETRGSRLRARLVAQEKRAMAWIDGLTRYERRFRQLAVPLMIGVAVLLLLGFWLE